MSLATYVDVYYDSNNIPSTEKLIADLKELITEYMKLK